MSDFEDDLPFEEINEPNDILNQCISTLLKLDEIEGDDYVPGEDYAGFVFNKVSLYICKSTMITMENLFKPEAKKYFANDLAVVPIIIFVTRIFKVCLAKNSNFAYSRDSDYKISTVLEFGLGIAFGKDLVEELMPYIMEKSSESKIPQINNAIYCIGLSNILDHPILDIYEFLNKGKELGLDEAEDMFADVAEDMQEVVANPLNFIHSIIHYAGRLSEDVSDDIFSRGGSYGIQLRQLFQ